MLYYSDKKKFIQEAGIMKKFHLNSLKRKITFSYAVLFFFLFIVFSMLYYLTAYHTFLDTHARNSEQIAKVISSQTGEYVYTVNSIETRILESEEILDYIFNGAKERDVTKDWQFRKDLYSITGYSYGFYHMNIVNLEEGTLHTFGEEFDYQPYTYSTETVQNVIDPILSQDGARTLLPPGAGCLYAPREKVPVLTVSRCFGRYTLSEKTALIEIQISIESLERMIYNILYDYENGGETVLIFDADNNPIYTSGLSDEELDYYLSLDTDNQSTFRKSLFSTAEMITTQVSSDTGFKTILITPESYLARNRQFYIGICLAFFLIFFGLTILITSRLAHRITAPITALKDRISSFELAQIAQEDYQFETDQAPDHAYSASSGRTFNELEILNESYDRMQRRLKKSLDDVISSRTLTIHSQMMALQAQMDSHFLYNTLTIISIIAENNDDEQAATMCVRLTRMLRYITEDISKDTVFSEEIEHTKNYTELISVRFGNGVDFCYDTDPSLYKVRVPRLIIQPFVENSVKYSRQPGKTLSISIRSWQDGTKWYANIQDNGSGFSNETLASFRAQTAKIDPVKKNPILSISGMGLVNIYLRMKLYYNDNFTFKLENITRSDSVIGASVTIGGTINEHK